MKYLTIFSLLFVIFVGGCRPLDVKLTISYNRTPQDKYPYASYGETAKIYYTVAGKNYEHTVQHNRSIQITVPERTLLRARFEKFLTDATGPHSTTEDVFLTVDKDAPVWNL